MKHLLTKITIRNHYYKIKHKLHYLAQCLLVVPFLRPLRNLVLKVLARKSETGVGAALDVRPLAPADGCQVAPPNDVGHANGRTQGDAPTSGGQQGGVRVGKGRTRGDAPTPGVSPQRTGTWERLFRRRKRSKRRSSLLPPTRRHRLAKFLSRHNIVPKPVRKVGGMVGRFLYRFLIDEPFVKRARDPDPEGYTPRLQRSKKDRFIERFRVGTWGWIALVALASAAGLILIALAYGHSRNEGTARIRTYFYPAIILLFAPLAARMIYPHTSRTERIISLSISGICCYLIKVLTSPLHLYLYDEFLHWRTANDIIASGHFFTLNALLPVSPYYPSLEIVTLAFGMISGLDVFHSALLLIGIARLMTMLTLFALNEEMFHSPRTASIATLFYMINPHYIFFDTQYAYESLALPLALVLFLIILPYQSVAANLTRLNIVATSVASSVVFLTPSATMPVAKKRDRLRDELKAIKLTGILVIVSLTFSHHATDFFFIALLGLWVAIYRLMRLGHLLRSFPFWLVLVGLVCAICWINAPNNPVLPYLLGFLSSIFGHSGKHFTPKAVNSYSALPWEKTLAQNGSYFTMAIVPIGVLFLWQRYSAHAFARMLGLMSLGFPASYVLRSSDNGIQLADRALAVLFIGVSSGLAVLITQLWPVRRFHWYHIAFIVPTLTLLFMGGYILSGGSGYGSPPTPYVVGADSRSIEIEGIQAATWMSTYFGPNNRVGTDRTNQLLMATFGNQRIIESIADHVDVAPIFLDPSLTHDDIVLMERAMLRYLAVDQRMSTALPAVGAYIEKGEPGAMQHDTPIPLPYLTKFNTLPGMNRVFDGGNMVIYDVRGYVYAHKKY